MEVTTKELRRCDVVTAEGVIDSSTVEILTQALASLMWRTGNFGGYRQPRSYGSP